MGIFREESAESDENTQDIELHKVEQTFTDRLEKILIERGIKKGDFARSIGIAPNTLSGYLTRQHLPDLTTFTAICRKLDISANYLLGLSDNPNIDTDHSANEDELLTFYRLISEKYQNEVIGEVKGILRLENRSKN